MTVRITRAAAEAVLQEFRDSRRRHSYFYSYFATFQQSGISFATATEVVASNGAGEGNRTLVSLHLFTSLKSGLFSNFQPV
jgi:hypothetical protein